MGTPAGLRLTWIFGSGKNGNEMSYVITEYLLDWDTDFRIMFNMVSHGCLVSTQNWMPTPYQVEYRGSDIAGRNSRVGYRGSDIAGRKSRVAKRFLPYSQMGTPAGLRLTWIFGSGKKWKRNVIRDYWIPVRLGYWFPNNVQHGQSWVPGEYSKLNAHTIPGRISRVGYRGSEFAGRISRVGYRG